MKRYFLYMILATVSSTCFAFGEEKICGPEQIKNDACNKGDVLMFGNNNGRAIALFCDLNKPVSIVNNDGGFVCYYIGYQRQMRK